MVAKTRQCRPSKHLRRSQILMELSPSGILWPRYWKSAGRRHPGPFRCSLSPLRSCPNGPRGGEFRRQKHAVGTRAAQGEINMFATAWPCASRIEAQRRRWRVRRCGRLGGCARGGHGDRDGRNKKTMRERRRSKGPLKTAGVCLGVVVGSTALLQAGTALERVPFAWLTLRAGPPNSGPGLDSDAIWTASVPAGSQRYIRSRTDHRSQKGGMMHEKSCNKPN